MKKKKSSDAFQKIVRHMKDRHDINVKCWRKSMSGKAWRNYHDDGRVVNWVESPEPKSPISLAIFLHEVGHHVIGFEKYRIRCEEEYHVWVWAIKEMCRHNVPPDKKVYRRFDLSIRYAVGKALRRGLKTVPECLLPYAPMSQKTLELRPTG